MFDPEGKLNQIPTQFNFNVGKGNTSESIFNKPSNALKSEQSENKIGSNHPFSSFKTEQSNRNPSKIDILDVIRDDMDVSNADIGAWGAPSTTRNYGIVYPMKKNSKRETTKSKKPHV